MSRWREHFFTKNYNTFSAIKSSSGKYKLVDSYSPDDAFISPDIILVYSCYSYFLCFVYTINQNPRRLSLLNIFQSPVHLSLWNHLVISFLVNRKGCWCWYLMEHIHNNLMKLGINCTLENGLRVRNISSFYKKFLIFCGMLPSDPPNFIKLLPRYFNMLHQQLTLSW
jgi:hypothetical protein